MTAPGVDQSRRAVADPPRDHVVLVDAQDRVVGVADKLDAHLGTGLLHRAFSVFIVDRHDRVLLQRRAASKYHFAGLWSNACCSHPRAEETVLDAARRRLPEEIGLLPEELFVVGRFEYRAADPRSGFVEHELDHVVVGFSDDEPTLNPAEADAYRWITFERLAQTLTEGRLAVTPWLQPALDVVRRAGRGPSTPWRS